MAKEKYTLYLDESVSHHNNSNKVFCMAGVIIKDVDYQNIIIPEINILKSRLWHDLPNSSDIIIHQKEINEAKKNGYSRNSNYDRFRRNQYMRMLYNGFDNIFSLNLMTVVGACIVHDDLNRYFTNGIKSDRYLIALQILIENYVHFLSLHNGIGTIVYESLNPTDNEKMRTRFYNIKLMGSMYINSSTMIRRLHTIEFPEKKDNIIGLQIADFVPNYFARKQLSKPAKRFNIDNQLRRFRYDGNLNLRDRFGVKIMP